MILILILILIPILFLILNLILILILILGWAKTKKGKHWSVEAGETVSSDKRQI